MFTIAGSDRASTDWWKVSGLEAGYWCVCDDYSEPCLAWCIGSEVFAGNWRKTEELFRVWNSSFSWGQGPSVVWWLTRLPSSSYHSRWWSSTYGTKLVVRSWTWLEADQNDLPGTVQQSGKPGFKVGITVWWRPWWNRGNDRSSQAQGKCHSAVP